MSKTGRIALIPAPGVRLGLIRGQHFLFVPHRQLLFSADAVVSGLWPHLESGVFEDELEEFVGSRGRDAASVVADLTNAGAIEPISTAKGPVGLAARHHLRIGRLSVCVGFSDVGLAEMLLPALEHLRVPARRCDQQVLVLGGRRGVGIAVQGGKVEWSPLDQSAPALKVALGELALDSIEGAVALHAATLVRQRGTMLIIGEPGAGKSTLSVALEGAGFLLEGDDVAELYPDGTVRAVPFPVTIKDGAWPLVSRIRPELRDAPRFHRSDGKRVSYLPLAAAAEHARRSVRWIIALEREGSPEARLDLLSTEEALSELLKGAWAEDERLSPWAFEGIVACLENASCFRLHYSDLEAAVSLLDQVWTRASSNMSLAL